MNGRRLGRVLMVCVGTTLLASTCGSPEPRTISAGGVVARRVLGTEPAPRLGAVVLAPGDFVLASGTMRVVVGGLQREGASRGAILEAAFRGAPAEDSIVLWAPVVYVADRAWPVVTRSITVVERRGKPGLRIAATSAIAGRTVDVTRELLIADRGAMLYQTTRVVPQDGLSMRNVRIGARIGWGGDAPFVPGHGPLADDAWHETNWMGIEGTSSSNALSTDDGPMRVRAVYERNGPSLLLQHTDVAAPAHDIAADGVLVDRTILVAARGGLAQAVRGIGWARGTPYPEVLVTLPYSPAGAAVRILTEDDRPVLSARPDERGRAIIPFPPLAGAAGRAPRFHAIATAFGHAPSDEVPIDVRHGARARVEIARGGQIRIVAVDPSGARIVSRARVVGVGQTRSPELGPDWSAAGCGDTVVLSEGLADVPVEPGRYRVIVTHGPEWTLHDETVEVSATFRPEVRAVLSHVVDPGDWVASDFHVHASPSPDSRVTLEDRLASFAAEGVRFAAATDHNYVTDYAPVARQLGLSGFGSVTGVEVTTEEPIFGHFNAFPFPLDPSLPQNGAPAWTGTTPTDLFLALHARGPEVVVQVNHPRLEGGIGYFERMGLDVRTGVAEGPYSDAFDTLEVWNGFDLARIEQFERVLTEWMGLLARGHRYVATGNSDSHTVRLQVVGYPRTYVRVPGGSVDDGRAVVAALRQGRAFVTSGPFLDVTVGGHGPGEIAPATDRVVRAHVVVRAPPWMSADDVTVFVNGEPARTAVIAPRPPATRPGRPRPAPTPLPVLRYEATLEVPVTSDAFVVVEVRGRTAIGDFFGRGGALPIAFTNPIWIDVDGDGGVVITPPSDVPVADSAVAVPDGGGEGTPSGARDAAAAADAGADSGPGRDPVPAP